MIRRRAKGALLPDHRYAALERKLRFTLQCGRTLEETTGIAVPGNARPARKPQLGRIHVSRTDQSTDTHPL